MDKQKPIKHDPWPVIDGPWKGRSIASVDDDFEVQDPYRNSRRVRYYLRALEGGGYAWSCAALA